MRDVKSGKRRKDAAAGVLPDSGSKRIDVFSLRALLALRDVECDFLPLEECLATCTVDSRVVYEDILATLHGDKTITFFIIEPFNGTLDLL